jgi:hypothetical protein
LEIPLFENLVKSLEELADLGKASIYRQLELGQVHAIMCENQLSGQP